MKGKLIKHKSLIIVSLKVLTTLLVVIFSNYYLQLSQNDFSWELATKFAFSWHTSKFFLGCFALLAFAVFLISVIGSWSIGMLFYSVVIGILGFANYQKMFYRTEPIYPDDLKMVTELGLMKEMVGTGPFLICLLVLGIAIGCLLYGIYRSFFLAKKIQYSRLVGLGLSLICLVYISQFNQPTNLFRKKFDKTALWIPYSQKMNYYNVGFVGGFLYNLKVEPMAKPTDYSKERIAEIVDKYQSKTEKGQADDDQPNIIYVMSESFSDPLRLKGLQTDANPLKAYKEIAVESYSGQMLSQNYGGGTANIEFEALTGFSMEPFNSQLTTPYTMLVPGMVEMPSLVSLLKEKDYQTTAIHPYNTSMYKRKDVYSILGFDRFIDESTMAHTTKIGNNAYVSDEAAYQEVLDVLADKQDHFVHLVTMQTHMPYKDKYPVSGQVINGVSDPAMMDSYLQDIEYASLALKSFLKELEKLPKRTLVVFWGDHLPSIYSDEYQAQNTDIDLHLTEFLFYDSKAEFSAHEMTDSLLSPVYFAPKLFDLAELPQSGFYQLLLSLEKELPAFEKNFYYHQEQWQEKMPLSGPEKELYDEYTLIQYDIVSGKQYSLGLDFYK